MLAFEIDSGPRGWYWVFLAWLIVVGVLQVRRRRRNLPTSPSPVGPGHGWLARQPRSLRLGVTGMGASLATVFAVAERKLWLLILVAAVVIWAVISERWTSGS